MKEKLFELVQKVVDTFGLEIYHLEFKKNVLRVWIESKKSPITVETCALVSQSLSARLDAVDLIPHRYRLEVSSPGVERGLFTPVHYQRAIGSDCQLNTKYGVILGRILAADNDKVKLAITQQSKKNNSGIAEMTEPIIIPYSDIKSGHLVVSSEILFSQTNLLPLTEKSLNHLRCSTRSNDE
ncbi:MAG: ribosome maturation factor RimP [candidate division WOR-3 bacterium]